MKIDMWVIDKDCCPENDQIIIKGDCASCPYYKGFQMCNSQPCVKCSFYDEESKKK